VNLGAHGIHVKLPQGWSGRIFSRQPKVATLHAGNYPLALEDGEFGSRSTAAMSAGASFIALTEYRPGAGLKPRSGLFHPPRLPTPLHARAFAASQLAHPHPGQVGTQHFFTASGRPFCLYVVLDGPRANRRRQVAAVNHVLSTLRIEPRR
jgi:hypothetical protein